MKSFIIAAALAFALPAPAVEIDDAELELFVAQKCARALPGKAAIRKERKRQLLTGAEDGPLVKEALGWLEYCKRGHMADIKADLNKITKGRTR